MFQLPIQYNTPNEVDATLIQELELVNTADASGVPIYHHVFSPTTPVSKQIVSQIAKYYTTNTSFLKDSILFHKRFNHEQHSYTEFIDHWNTIQQNEEFKLTYQYINHEKLSSFNESSKFMFMISLYFITSPVLFILSPLVMVLIPFAILQMQGQPITWNSYKTQLFEVTKRHALVHLCTGYSNATPKEKMMMFASASIFLIQTYCNGYAVYKFYTNIQAIHTIMESTKQHVEQCLESIHYIQSISSDLSTYKEFLGTLQHHESILSNYYNKLTHVSKLSFSWKEFVHLGMLRAQFYELYSNPELKASIDYSIQLCGYLENIEHLSKQTKLNACTFTTEKETSFSKAYYPTDKPVKNSYKLKKNIIITGPNASGKTTFIKMTLINTLLSQQIGCGFYKKASIYPYDSFCSYINIPDTSGRDSLFQAEARRCKQVLDSVKDKTKRVFCIFDELFSGTNPQEASASAFAFLQYLALQTNCTFLLTTHFIDVCRNLKENTTIVMKHMKTIQQKNKLIYTYQLSNGLSTIHGGIHVLMEMDYPMDIIQNAKLCG
jgi:energy-coupling factor transporter ATP-binding protein EcfA2